MKLLDHKNRADFEQDSYFITLTLQRRHHCKKIPLQVRAMKKKICKVVHLLRIDKLMGVYELTKTGNVHFHCICHIDIAAARCYDSKGHYHYLKDLDFCDSLPMAHAMLKEYDDIGIFDIQIPKSLDNVLKYLDKDVEKTSQYFANTKTNEPVVNFHNCN